ncbi:hypothetical protein, partial [Xanthomonas citri]|uniref:hypothetical protein n=2 Tax=Xanthomonas citri TaxID=346 RepID=UPI0010D7A846
ATGDGADALYALPRERFAHGKQLSWLRDRANQEEQFANSPDLKAALMHAIMDAFDAHQTMSTQALGSERVRDGLKDILLGPAQLYEALRARPLPGDQPRLP